MNVADIRHIAVVGAGLMGHGIAQEFALAAYAGHLYDLSDAFRATAHRRSPSGCRGIGSSCRGAP